MQVRACGKASWLPTEGRVWCSLCFRFFSVLFILCVVAEGREDCLVPMVPSHSTLSVSSLEKNDYFVLQIDRLNCKEHPLHIPLQPCSRALLFIFSRFLAACSEERRWFWCGSQLFLRNHLNLPFFRFVILRILSWYSDVKVTFPQGHFFTFRCLPFASLAVWYSPSLGKWVLVRFGSTKESLKQFITVSRAAAQPFSSGRIFALAWKRSYRGGGSSSLSRPFPFFQCMRPLTHRWRTCRRTRIGYKRWKHLIEVSIRDSCSSSYLRLCLNDWSFFADIPSSHTAAFLILLRFLRVFAKCGLTS